MADLTAPWLTASVVIPCAAAVLVRFADLRPVRGIGVAACSAALLLSLEAVYEVMRQSSGTLAEPWAPGLFHADALNAVTLALFAILALVTLLSAPRRDVDARSVSRLLFLTAGTLLAYGSSHLWLFALGWIVALPFEELRRPSRLAVASAVLLCVGVALQQANVFAPSAFLCLTAAAILQTGLFPFHGVIASPHANRSLLSSGLRWNAHLGAFLMIRWAVPLLPEGAGAVLQSLCAFALLSAIFTAILGFTAREPRRAIALIFVSQSSAIFAGLVSNRPEGTTGALIQWIVLGIASTVMLAVCAGLEARVAQPLAGEGFLGLVAHMPRLAVFFVVSALSLLGLPGTLGFPGEDLLIHGVLSAQPVIGMLLPAAIAINAYHAYRLFSRLFLGAPTIARSGSAKTSPLEALPRERWAFALCLILLVAGGLWPSGVVALRLAAADRLASPPIHSSARQP